MITESIPALSSGEKPRGEDESPERLRLRQAARDFESLFLQVLIRRMSRAQLDNGFFGKGTGASTYEGMFQSFLSDRLGDASPLGIADLLLRQWEQRGEDVEAVQKAVGEARRLDADRAYRQEAAQVPGIPADTTYDHGRKVSPGTMPASSNKGPRP